MGKHTVVEYLKQFIPTAKQLKQITKLVRQHDSRTGNICTQTSS